MTSDRRKDLLQKFAALGSLLLLTVMKALLVMEKAIVSNGWR